MTPQKFQTLTQQIIDLDIDTAERLEGAIDLIFEKVGILYTCHLTGGEKITEIIWQSFFFWVGGVEKCVKYAENTVDYVKAHV